MGKTDLSTSLEHALNRAFAARDPKVRAAYMDLAEFYELQLKKSSGSLSAHPVHFR
jgi:hypothetical protein